MNKLSIKGVVVGGVIDIVATVILTLPLVVYVIATEPPDTVNDSLQAAVLATIQGSPLLYGLQSIIGLVCSVLGGYVAAKMAKHDELLNGVLASSLPVALGVFSLSTERDSGPLLLPVMLLLASPLCGGLGGYLRLVQIRGRAHSELHDVSHREDVIFQRARDALQKIGTDVVDVKQIESIQAALDLQVTGAPRRHNALGVTFQAFAWKIVLSVSFWIIVLIVIAVVMSHTGVDLFGMSRKLTGH